MTDQQQHPITPSPELAAKWVHEIYGNTVVIPLQQPTLDVIARAAQWGYEQRGEVNEAELQKARDQELEACCALMDDWGLDGNDLMECRRPKPPRLKEQALKTLEDAPGPDYPSAMTVLNADQHALIRRALEALPDD